MSISDSPTDIAIQEQMADSLVAPLDAEGQPLSQEYGEQEYGQEQGGQEGPLNERDEINAQLWDQAEQIRESQQDGEREQFEQGEQAQTAEVSPQEVLSVSQQLDQQVSELGLNDPSESMILASALGVDPSNAGTLGAVASKTTLSTLGVLESCGGDLANLGKIPTQSSLHYSAEFHKFLGIDPRMSGANHEQITGAMLYATANIVKTLETYGLNADVSQWNTPEASEYFVNLLMQAFPNAQRADREYCLKAADAYCRHVQSDLKKIVAQQSQQQARPGRQSQSRQSQGRRAAPARQRSSGRAQMRTNTDIFDDEAMDYYQMQHGRL